MREADLGWTAGILDGEGHLGIAKSPNYGVKLSVGNTDARMLNRLQELWGGKIYFDSQISSQHNSKPFWHWQVNGKEAFMVLDQVLPFMVAKQDQASLVLEMKQWYGKRTAYDPDKRDFWRNQRESIFQRLRKLTKRGSEE